MGQEIITQPQQFNSAVTINSDLTAADIHSTQGTFDLFNLNKNKFSISTNKWAFTNSSGTEVASIDTSGNLSVTGNLSSLGTTTQIDTQVFVTSAVSVTNTGTGPALTVKQTGAQDIATFFDDSNTALIIKDGGNVGIGASTPNEKLTVSGNISASGNVYTKSAYISQTGKFTNNEENDYILIDPSNDSISFVSNSIEAVRIISSGNVGFGTTTPNERLTVVGDISATGDVSVNTGSRLNLATGSTGMSIFRDGGSNGMAFSSNDNLTRMFIADGGNVGINTSNPNERLTVAGNISATGNLTIDGNVTLCSNGSDTLTFNGGPINYPNATVAADAIIIGTDVNLYRSTANVLRTDDSLSVGQDLSAADIYSSQSTFDLFNSTKNKLSIEAGRLSFTSNTGTVAASIATDGTTILGEMCKIGVAGLGNSNLAIGYSTSDYDVTKGSNNTVFGTFNINNASFNGSSNTVFGSNNGQNITTGTSNTLIGTNNASYLTTGNSNFCAGYAAGGAYTTGSNNINIGDYAGNAVGTAVSNSVCVGVESGRGIQNNSSIAVGYRSYGYVGTSGNTGTGNTAVGVQSLYSIEGAAAGNTALGTSSLESNTTGSYNTAVGGQAIKNNTTGAGNIGIGYQANLANTTGAYNIAIGHQALYTNTGGNHNIAIGRSALKSFNNSFGTNGFNVAIGYNALGSTNPTSNVEGIGNTALGYGAGDANTTGSYNTFIGYDAIGTVALTGTNNTCLGYASIPSSLSASNEITLGNSSITSLRCNDQTIAALSDARDKIKVENLSLGLDFINSLRPVKFEWKTREGSAKDGTQEAGFIAQELLDAQTNSNCQEYLKIVNQSNPDRLEAAYARLIPVLVKSIQDLSEQNKKLTEEVELLKFKTN